MDKEKILSDVQRFYAEHPWWIVQIRWATATWKTGMSIFLWWKIWLEIISADSRQIYRYMDIWTDKITEDERQWIPHHMLDVVDPDQTFTAWEWKQHVVNLLPDIQQRDQHICLVWGTGLYHDMMYKNFSMPDVAPDQVWREQMMELENKTPWYLYEQLQKCDPDEAMKHHPHSIRYILRALEIYEKTWTPKSVLAQENPVYRPTFLLWLWREKEDTNMRINKRVKEMLAEGKLVEENQKLLDMWYTLEHTAMNWIGYKEVVGYLQWDYNLEKCEELLKRHTHRYAKRQRSWFRRYIMDMKAQPKANVKYEVFMCE